MTTAPRPQRVVSVTAKNRVNGNIETYRVRDPRISKEDAIAQAGMFLAMLGWKPKEIMITGCRAETEDAVTLAIRNRLVAKKIKSP